MISYLEKIILLNIEILFTRISSLAPEQFGVFALVVFSIVGITLTILALKNLIYKLLLLGLLSLVIVATWAVIGNEFIFPYLGYVVAFTGAVLMLFLSVILMLPLSNKEGEFINLARPNLKRNGFVEPNPTKLSNITIYNIKPTHQSHINLIFYTFAIYLAAVLSVFTGTYRSIKMLFIPTRGEVIKSYNQSLSIFGYFYFYRDFIVAFLNHAIILQGSGKVDFGFPLNNIKTLGEDYYERFPADIGIERKSFGGINDRIGTWLQAFSYAWVGFIIFWKREIVLSHHQYIINLERQLLRKMNSGCQSSLKTSLLKAFNSISLIWGIIAGLVLIFNAFVGLIPNFPVLFYKQINFTNTTHSGLVAVRDVLYDFAPLLLIVTALVLLVALIGAAIFLRRKGK